MTAFSVVEMQKQRASTISQLPALTLAFCAALDMSLNPLVPKIFHLQNEKCKFPWREVIKDAVERLQWQTATGNPTIQHRLAPEQRIKISNKVLLLGDLMSLNEDVDFRGNTQKLQENSSEKGCQQVTIQGARISPGMASTDTRVIFQMWKMKRLKNDNQKNTCIFF